MMDNSERRVEVYRMILLYFLLSITTKTVHSTPHARRICLHEYHHQPNNPLKGSNETNFEDTAATEITRCEKWANMCYILWREDIKDGKIFVKVLRRGCWSYENNKKESCNVTNCLSAQHSVGKMHFCCCQTDLCNIVSDFKTERVFQAAQQTSSSQMTGGPKPHKQEQTNVLFLAGILLAGAFLLLLTCTITTSFFCKRRKITDKQKYSTTISHKHPLLSELSRPEFITLIHMGNFSEIWNGRVKSKAVAIKKFKSSKSDRWKQEKEIYKLELNHPGVLKFFGAPILEETWDLSYILILEYHPKGSLRGVLKSHIISWETMCTMSKSLAEALAYLHGEQEKTSFSCIVHRNITSENILVTTDDTCVLCDFGLSCVMSTQQRSVVSHAFKQVGCPRYMAPEILQGRINLNDITSQLKQIDIFALGIVLWEISSRCEEISNGLEIPGYHLPERVTTMENLENDNFDVLKEKQQISFPDSWNTKIQRVKELKELISHCLDDDSEARLSASCVCHRINELQENHMT